MKQFWMPAALSLAILGSSSSAAAELEMRGNIEAQGRFFFEEALFDEQHDVQLSAAITPEFYWSFNNGDDSIEFVPFVRVDQHDDERTHGDIRELSWVHVADDWESRIGVRRVFWGVTEFQHLVDVINQTDAVEDIDNEDKLGQPMLNLSLVRDWGIVDFFVLPYFRERTFAGPEGRPTIPLVDTDLTMYEDSDEENHIDFAVRWAHSIGDYEVALSYFDGTRRDPLLMPVISPVDDIVLAPFYQQVGQFGVELQANIESMLWKLEMLYSDNSFENYTAVQGGFEYTQYGVFESAADLGWLMEYAWDERGEDALTTFQNDIFFGSRLAFNDVDSSEILFGFSYDMDYSSTSVLVEASSRFGDSLKVSIDARFFESDEPEDSLYLFRRDDHIQLTAQYFY